MHRLIALEGPLGGTEGAKARARIDAACDKTMILCHHIVEVFALPKGIAVAIDDAIWHQAMLLRREQPDPLVDPRALARFLCGLTSPKLTHRRLTVHQLFGALAHIPFATVLQRATHDQGQMICCT
jgi:hypothetical protein